MHAPHLTAAAVVLALLWSACATTTSAVKAPPIPDSGVLVLYSLDNKPTTLKFTKGTFTWEDEHDDLVFKGTAGGYRADGEEEECETGPAQPYTTVEFGPVEVRVMHYPQCDHVSYRNSFSLFRRVKFGAEEVCKPRSYTFQKVGGETTLAVEDDCSGEITAALESEDGYAVHLQPGDGDAWSGSETFMSHPIHTASYSLSWKRGAKTLKVLSYDEDVDEMSAGGEPEPDDEEFEEDEEDDETEPEEPEPTTAEKAVGSYVLTSSENAK